MSAEPELDFFSALRHKDSIPATKPEEDGNRRQPREDQGGGSGSLADYNLNHGLYAIWHLDHPNECEFVTAKCFLDALVFGENDLAIPDPKLRVIWVAHTFGEVIYPHSALRWHPTISAINGGPTDPEEPERARAGCLILNVELDEFDDNDGFGWVWSVTGATERDGYSGTKEGAKALAERAAKAWLANSLSVFPVE